MRIKGAIVPSNRLVLEAKIWDMLAYNKELTYPHVEHEPCLLQKIDKHTEHIKPVSIIYRVCR